MSFPEEYLAKQWDQTQLADGTPIVAVLDRRKTPENLRPDASHLYLAVLSTGWSFAANEDGWQYDEKNGYQLKPVAPPKPATRPMTRDEFPQGPCMVRLREDDNWYAVSRVKQGTISVDYVGAISWQQLHDEDWEYNTGDGWHPCKVESE